MPNSEIETRAGALATCVLFEYIPLGALLTAAPAMACSFDTDYQPGSQCLKASGSIYGVCAGGPCHPAIALKGSSIQGVCTK